MKNKNFKVVVLAGDLGIGGAEKQMIYYLKSLIDLAFNVHLVCLCEPGKTIDSITSLKINYSIINNKSRILRVINLYRLLSEINPKIIHCWHFFTAGYTYFYSLYSSSIILGSIRGDGNLELKVNNRFFLYFILNSPKYFVVNSKNAIKNFSNILKINSSKLKYLSNVIDISKISKINKNEEEFDVIIISNLLELKQLDLFIKSIGNVKKHYNKINVLILGEGPERLKLELLIKELGLVNNISMPGVRMDAISLISKSKIGVLTSKSEGFPNVILEYMACSKPVISTDVGDSKNIVKDNFSGFILSSDDIIKDLSNKIIYLLRNKNIRIKMGNNGRNLIEDNYSFNNLSNHITNLYKEIL